MHSSMANTRYGLHVQMSEPKTSEPLPVSHTLNMISAFKIGYGRCGTPTFIVNTESEFL